MNKQFTVDDLCWMLRHRKRSFSFRSFIYSARSNFRRWKSFWKKYHQYQWLTSDNPKQPQPSLKFLYPCLNDDTETTSIEPIYFYQDAWAFEKVVQTRPTWHVDVGSHHTYVALLSKVVRVTMVDIRPLSLSLSTLDFREGSILDLPFEDKSISSLSSLCVIEHIGLGRYGDPLDPRGSEKALLELKRVLAPEGNLFLSLPIDTENRVYFNAHRAFSESYLFEQFSPLTVLDKQYIFGNSFSETPKSGFGVGCYHLRG